MEVDVPILSRAASVDLHIDLIQAACCGELVYLHSSPEYGMKRLLSAGSGDIYQMSHVFRDEEKGERHTPEFMMVEWYRIGITLRQMITETVQFIQLFLEDVPEEFTEMFYKEAFINYVGRYPAAMEEQDALYGFEIEPQLGHNTLMVVTDFPPERAALSQIGKNGLAERFEIYFRGIELANGYHELLDPDEQRKRITLANEARLAHGKGQLPVDEEFITALEQGMPDCCGVAVGFDRLMMLRHQVEEIREISSFFI
jgi:elongation factor P--(R)-beta-lysine ligase